MPVHVGVDGIYAGPNMERVEPSSGRLTQNAHAVYLFNKGTGVLQLSMSPLDIQLFLEEHGAIPEQGVNLELSVAFLPFGTLTFEGVKEIRPMPDVEENQYALKYTDIIYH